MIIIVLNIAVLIYEIDSDADMDAVIAYNKFYVAIILRLSINNFFDLSGNKCNECTHTLVF